MTRNLAREPQPRPFPWLCTHCGTTTVVPSAIDYTAKVKHDGVVHELHLKSAEIPQCSACRETVITTAVDERINEALRAKLGLMSPAQIRRNIETLGLTQDELAEWVDVAPETLSRVVNGALIPSARMNKRLRMLFAFPAAREMLRQLDRDPNLGLEVSLQS